MAQKWTAEEHSYLKELVNNADKNNWKAFALSMCQMFNKPFTPEKVRSYWRMNVRNSGGMIEPNYSETVEILSNGSVKSDKLIELSLEQAKDQQYILEAHGFDAKEWEVVSAKSSQWNHQNKELGTSTMYSSKVTVKPRKKDALNEHDVLRELARDIKPVIIPTNYTGENNLVIGLADLHFGITQLSDTLAKLDDIKSIIQNGYKQIVIEHLGDLFHSSQMKTSQTLKGTILDDVDMVKAIEDAKTFFDVIITEALQYSKKVSVEHASGNHSDNMEYMFLVYLEAKYPDVKVNYHNEYRTAYMIDNVGIMVAHGDNAKNKLPQLFATEYKMIWSLSETMEIHTGHRHSFEKDYDGVILRQFGTIKPNDAYEVRNGWTSNRKVIQMIEYDQDRCKVIYEV